MSAGAHGPHVVLVPVPAQGHINPFISLAHFLATSGISVTFVHSARSHSLMSAAHSTTTTTDNAHNIRIEVLPDGMPSADTKQRISFENLQASAHIMCKGLEELLQNLMQEDNAPCCLIVDGFLSWRHDVAVKFGLPRVDIWTVSVSVCSIGFHIRDLVAKGYIPAVDKESRNKRIDFIPGLAPFCASDLPNNMKSVDGVQSPSFQLICSAFEHSKGADRGLVNTIYELEISVVEALMAAGNVRLDPVGPLFMMSSISTTLGTPASLLQEDNSCVSWLDQQRKSSVLYISFGSLATVEEDVFEELAHGLEASGESFLWVIRPDAHKDKAIELLPEGFMERTRDRGMVISWAPQLAVLGHPSVGAFLTHCGWNSVLESLSNGIPMLGFPQVAEQRTNLKLIVHDWKVGLPLVEDDAHKVEHTHVQHAVSAIMKTVEGMQARKRALEWRDIAHKAPNGTAKANLQKLVDDLKYGHFKPFRVHGQANELKTSEHRRDYPSSESFGGAAKECSPPKLTNLTTGMHTHLI